VPIEKVKENEWSLAAGRYKPVQVETVKHDPPKQILKEVLALEEEIAERSKKLLSPKFQEAPEGILLIPGGVAPNSLSRYWEQFQ
jgi:hypothetical protein